MGIQQEHIDLQTSYLMLQTYTNQKQIDHRTTHHILSSLITFVILIT